eukprot:Rmarinus@m.14608
MRYLLKAVSAQPWTVAPSLSNSMLCTAGCSWTSCLPPAHAPRTGTSSLNLPCTETTRRSLLPGCARTRPVSSATLTRFSPQETIWWLLLRIWLKARTLSAFGAPQTTLVQASTQSMCM